MASTGAVDRCMETFISSTVAATAEAAVGRGGDGGCDLSGRCRRDRSVPNGVSDEGARGRLVDYRRTGRDRVVQGTTSSQTQAQALNGEGGRDRELGRASLVRP